MNSIEDKWGMDKLAKGKTEFRVGSWAIGTIPDDGRRANQVVLAMVKQSHGMTAIVMLKDGTLIDTANSPRKWFALENRDEGCASLWERGKHQWKHYWSMLGGLSQAQKKATRDPNQKYDDIDERPIGKDGSGGAAAPIDSAPVPVDIQKPVSDAPTPVIPPVADEAATFEDLLGFDAPKWDDSNIDQHPRMIEKLAEEPPSAMIGTWEEHLNGFRNRLLRGDLSHLTK